jgi:NADH:ubiquinone oxidoreductase subunit E
MITINVCIGSVCHINGSYNIINIIQNLINERNLEDKVTVKGAFCLGNCTKPVSVRVDEGEVVSVNEKNIIEFFDAQVVGRL